MRRVLRTKKRPKKQNLTVKLWSILQVVLKQQTTLRLNGLKMTLLMKLTKLVVASITRMVSFRQKQLACAKERKNQKTAIQILL